MINIPEHHKVYKGKDNAILASFDSVIDIDLALWRYIKDKYSTSEYLDKDMINIDDENIIKFILMDRREQNPLSLLIPNYDTEKMYNDIINNDSMLNNILVNYGSQFDTLKLFITFMNNASSIDIDILCKNNGQAEIIKKYTNNKIGAIINSAKDVDMNNYSIIQVKFFSDIIYYPELNGKYIWIANALYNMQRNMNTIDLTLFQAFGQSNKIQLIDMYRDVKWFFTSKSNDEIERKVDEELNAERNKIED